MTPKPSRRPGPHLSPTPNGPGASPYVHTTEKQGASVSLSLPGKRVDARHRKGCGELPSGQRTRVDAAHQNAELPRAESTGSAGSVVAGGESVDHSLRNDAGRDPNRVFSAGASRSRDSRRDGTFSLWSDEQVAKARAYTTKQLIRGRLVVWTETVKIAGAVRLVPTVIAEELLDIDSETTLRAVLRSLPVSSGTRRIWLNWWRELRHV